MKGRFMTGLAVTSLCLLMVLAGWTALAPAEEIAFPEEPAYEPADFVYVTPSGSKFYRPDCASVQNSSNLECLKREDAVQSGYEACIKCVP